MGRVEAAFLLVDMNLIQITVIVFLCYRKLVETIIETDRITG
jgi:hypothetical protein